MKGYSHLLATHGVLRWLVLISLLYALFKAYSGWMGQKKFSKGDGLSRTLAVIFLHVQLLLGLGLYFMSPVVSMFRENSESAGAQGWFFGIYHLVMMLVAVVIATIGSAKSRRGSSDEQKFAAMARFFTIALVLIILSIPWPFLGDLARPLFRGF